MRRIGRTMHALAALSALAAGCGPSVVTVEPRAPQPSAHVARQRGVSSVRVSVAQRIPQDRQSLLVEHEVPRVIENGIVDGFTMGGLQRPDGVRLDVEIFELRLPKTVFGGPARLGVRVTVHDGAGQLIETFERQSASIRGGSDVMRLQLLSQDIVEKVLDET